MSSLQLETTWLGRISFDDALLLQQEALEDVRQGGQSRLFLLEHEPVFTIGRTRDQSSLRAAASLPHPVREINRGGQATYHGPGQLVGYAIIDLRHLGKDLHRYLRFLETVLIEALTTYEINAIRRESFTGVWVESRKIASLGVGVRHWITMHGFALNVHGDLPGFSSITPCGIDDVVMTSIAQETGAVHEVESVADRVGTVFRTLFSM